jgi:hypothetical protein
VIQLLDTSSLDNENDSAFKITKNNSPKLGGDISKGIMDFSTR